MSRTFLLVSVAVAALWSCPSAAQAQTPPASDPQSAASQPQTEAGTASGSRAPEDQQSDGSNLGDIVVTAQRTSQNVQKVSQSIDVVSGETIATRGITDTTRLAAIVPGVVIKQGITPAVFIRGIGTSNPSTTGDQGVALHLDGVFQSRSTAFGAGFFDVSRVEILKGPQGTLYGRGSIGGSVNVITNAPSNNFEGNATLEVGNYGAVRAMGAVNIPIASETDTALRVAFLASRHDGYASNGGDDDNSRGVRLRFRSKAADNLTVDLTGFYFEQDNVGIAYYPVRNYSGRPADPDNWKSFIDLKELNQRNNTRFLLASSEINWDLPFARITYLPAYEETEDHGDTYYLSTSGVPTDVRRDLISKTTTNEFRIASLPSSRITWVAGAYHLYEDNGYNIFRGLTFGSLKTKSTSLFGQVTLPIGDDFRVIGGVRQTWESKKQNANNRFNFSQDYKVLNWRGSLEYDLTSASMLYLTAATGFKAGGFFTSAPINSFEPESSRTFELGSKNRFFDKRFQANLAIYHTDYDRYQVTVTIPQAFPGATLQGIFNGGNAEIYGAELETIWKATPNDTIEVSGNYNHTAFRTITVTGTLAKVGDQLPSAPLWSGNLAYTHKFDFGSGATLDARAESHLESTSYISLNRTPFTRQPGYSRSTVTLTFTPPSRDFTVSAWVRNIEDRAVRGFINEQVANETIALAPPRTFGGTISTRF